MALDKRIKKTVFKEILIFGGIVFIYLILIVQLRKVGITKISALTNAYWGSYLIYLIGRTCLYVFKGKK